MTFHMSWRGQTIYWTRRALWGRLAAVLVAAGCGGAAWAQAPTPTPGVCVEDPGPTPEILEFRKGDVFCRTGTFTSEVCYRLSCFGTADKFDIFILFDDTGSFAGEVPKVKDVFRTLVDTLEAELPGRSLAFGIGRLEDYGGPGDDYSFENTDGRPFILNQPIIESDASDFNALIETALEHEGPGFGGDGPETDIEALWQVATGDGFDGNDDDSTLGLDGSQVAGAVDTQIAPDDSGDVPEFASNVLPTSGNLGGVGFRPGAVHLVVLATDIGSVATFPPPTIPEFVTGLGGTVSVPATAFESFGRFGFVGNSKTEAGNTIPGAVAPSEAATVQETVDALNALDIKVVGMGPGAFPVKDPPRVVGGVFDDLSNLLSALALLTGAVNEDTGEPLVFDLDRGDAVDVADAIAKSIVEAIRVVASERVDVTLAAPDLPTGLLLDWEPEVRLDVRVGETACFDIELTRSPDFLVGAFDIEFMDRETGRILGVLPVDTDCTSAVRRAKPIMPFSPRTEVVGFHLTDPSGASALKELTIRILAIPDDSGGLFNPETELMPLDNTTDSGIAIYRDVAGSASQGAFDFEEGDPTGNDPLLMPTQISGIVPDGTEAYRVTFQFDAFNDPLTRVPVDPDTKADFFVVVRTSGNLAHGHQFQVTIPAFGILGWVRAGQTIGETFFTELGYGNDFPPSPLTWIGEIIKLVALTNDTVASTAALVKQVTEALTLVPRQYKVIDRQSPPTPVIGINAYGPRRENYRINKVVVTFDQIVRAAENTLGNPVAVFPEVQRFTPAALADLSDAALSGVSFYADHPDFQDGVFEPENDIRVPVKLSLLTWEEIVSGVRWRVQLEPDPVLGAPLTRVPANDTDPGTRGADFYVAIRTGDRIRTGDTFLVSMIEHADGLRGVQVVNGQDSLFWSQRTLSDATLPAVSPVSCHARPAFQYSDLTGTNPVIPKSSDLIPVAGLDFQDYGGDLASNADGFRMGTALDSLLVDFINVGDDSDFDASDLLAVIDRPVIDEIRGLVGGVMLFMDDSTPLGDNRDNDGDGVVDEEFLDGADNDGDGRIDEDVGDNDPAGINGVFDPYDDFLPVFPGRALPSGGTRYAVAPSVTSLPDGSGFRVTFRLVFQREGELNQRCLIRRIPPITGASAYLYRVLSQVFVFNPTGVGIEDFNNFTPLSDGTGIGPFDIPNLDLCDPVDVDYTYGIEIPNNNNPGGPNFGNDLFVVIRTSETVNDGDDFQVRISAGALTYYWIENAATSRVALDNQISHASLLTQPVVISAPVTTQFTGLVAPGQRLEALTDGDRPVPMVAIDLDVHSELVGPGSPALSGEFLEGITFEFLDVTNPAICVGHRFTVTKSGEGSDLLPLSNATLSGILVFQDSGADDGAFDLGDDQVELALTSSSVTYQGAGVYRVKLKFAQPQPIPANQVGEFVGPDYYVAIRASANLEYLDSFRLRIAAEGLSGSAPFVGGQHTTNPLTGAVRTFLTDVSPTVNDLGLPGTLLPITGATPELEHRRPVLGINVAACPEQMVRISVLHGFIQDGGGFEATDLLPVEPPLPAKAMSEAGSTNLKLQLSDGTSPGIALYRDYAGDGIDDDDDGEEESPVDTLGRKLADGIDNDGDGLTDEGIDEEILDGIDNDGDAPRLQSNGIDDDGDGEDGSPTDFRGRKLADGIDNDDDGFTDEGIDELDEGIDEDTAGAPQQFDVKDQLVPIDPLASFVSDNEFILKLQSTSLAVVPGTDDGHSLGDDFFLVLHGSNTAEPGDTFRISIPPRGLVFTVGSSAKSIDLRPVQFYVRPPNQPPQLVILEPDQPKEPLVGPPGFGVFTIVFLGNDPDDDALISLFWMPADATGGELPIPGAQNLPETQQETDFRPSTIPDIPPEVRIVGVISDGYNPPVRVLSEGTIDTTTEIEGGPPDIEMDRFRNTDETARTTTIAWTVRNGLGGTVDLTYVQEVGKILTPGDLNPDGTPTDEYIAQAGGTVIYGFIATGISVKGEGVEDTLFWDYNFLPSGDYRAVGVARRPIDGGKVAQDLDITPSLLSVPGGRRYPVSLVEKVGATPVVADFIGDASKEILVLTDQPGRLVLIGAEGRILASREIGSVGTGAPAVADINRDGTPEVVVALLDGAYPQAPAYLHVFNAVEGGGKQISLVRAFGAGPLAISTSGYAVVSSPAVADLFGDATREIAVGTIDGPSSGSLVIAGIDETSGDLEIKARVPFTGGKVQASPSVGMINAGGGVRTEIVLPVDDGFLRGISFPQGSGAPGSGTVETQVRTIPSGVPIGIPNPAILNPPASASLYDLDGDGSDEIFVGTLDGKFFVLHGDGQSVFGQQGGVPLPAFELPFVDSEGIPLDSWRREIRTTAALGRIDGEGYLDVVVAANNNRMYAFEVDPSGVRKDFFAYDDVNALPSSPDRFRRSSPTIAPLSQAGSSTYPSRSNVVIGGFDGRIHSVYLSGDSPATYRAVKTPVEDLFFNNALVGSIRATVFIADVNADGRNDVVYAGYTKESPGSIVDVVFGDDPAIPWSGGAPDWPTFQYDNTRTGRQNPGMGKIDMDINADGKVDKLDLFLLATRWGETGGEALSQSVHFRGAVDGVDAQDLLSLIRQWKSAE